MTGSRRVSLAPAGRSFLLATKNNMHPEQFSFSDSIAWTSVQPFPSTISVNGLKALRLSKELKWASLKVMIKELSKDEFGMGSSITLSDPSGKHPINEGEMNATAHSGIFDVINLQIGFCLLLENISVLEMGVMGRDKHIVLTMYNILKIVGVDGAEIYMREAIIEKVSSNSPVSYIELDTDDFDEF